MALLGEEFQIPKLTFHSELRRWAASRRALPCTSSFLSVFQILYSTVCTDVSPCVFDVIPSQAKELMKSYISFLFRSSHVLFSSRFPFALHSRRCVWKFIELTQFPRVLSFRYLFVLFLYSHLFIPTKSILLFHLQ